MQLLSYGQPKQAAFGNTTYTPRYMQSSYTAPVYATTPAAGNPLTQLLSSLTGGGASESEEPKKKGGLFGFIKKAAFLLGALFVLKKGIGMYKAHKASAAEGLDTLA